MSDPTKRQYQAGQFIFQEGDSSESLFIVQKGTVSVRKKKDGGYIELARIYQNETVGELSFFDRHPRSAACIAITEVETLEIPYENLEKIYKGVPAYIKTIVVNVADRLRKADESIKRLQTKLVDDDGYAKNNDDVDPEEILDAISED